jgi:hypothetical protein
MMWIKRINDTMAANVTLAMGTMWCVYLFLVWSLLPLIVTGSQQIVFYVSSGVLQLVCLPLIIVSQHVLNRARTMRAAQDHAAVMQVLADIKAVQLENASIELVDLDLGEVVQRLVRIEKAIKPPRVRSRKPTSNRSP